MTAESPAVRNIMLEVAYDGTRYAGWQVQPNGVTVQECVETAIQKVTGEAVRVLCAGRTDSGVHALGQVVSFRTESSIPAAQFRPAVQSALPRSRDIVVLRSREVHADFHATFSAVRKTYRYLLFDGEVLPPFLQRYAAFSRVPLDERAMQKAAQDLLGTHDFRCFESHYPNKATSIRTLEKAIVMRTSPWSLWSGDLVADANSQSATDGVMPRDESGRRRAAGDRPLIVFEFTADGFLYNMVRAIVGTLQDIGSGRHPPAHLRDVIESLDRAQAGATAAASGLYLVKVEYPDELLSVV